MAKKIAAKATSPSPKKNTTKSVIQKSAPAVKVVKPVAKKAPEKASKPAVSGKGARPVEKDAPMIIRKSPLNVKEMNAFRDVLIRQRDRVTGQINFLATDNLNRTQADTEVDFRSEEQGTDNFDRDFALTRVSSDQEAIFEIDEALNRIQMGSYGVCESCNNVIEKGRLSALPYSRMCVKCQSKVEASRRNFRAYEASTLFPSTDKASADVGSEEE